MKCANNNLDKFKEIIIKQVKNTYWVVLSFVFGLHSNLKTVFLAMIFDSV
jgi:hypothetical protein